MILKDQAIVLRMYPFGNTSRIVVWLSADYGKIATLVKGSQREKSPFLGQYDTFYTCEILFYAREHRQLHILKECTPLDTRPALRTDWRACAAASYFAGLIDRATPFGFAAPGLYHLLESILDHLAAHSPGPAFIPLQEWRILKELGLAPDWRQCGKCHTPFQAGRDAARLDPAAGTLHCAACAEKSAQPLSAEALAMLMQFDDEKPLPPALPERLFTEISRAIGGLLEYHADSSPHPRALTFQILSAPRHP